MAFFLGFVGFVIGVAVVASVTEIALVVGSLLGETLESSLADAVLNVVIMFAVV